jgi:CubicO group peptidase (beta-lactamase class C family)
MKFASRHASIALMLSFAATLDAGTNMDATSELTTRLRRYVKNNIMAGAVMLVADDKDILAFESIGMADISKGRPMSTDDLFWIASMTKPVTAAALMMLADEGRVSVDDPVEKYIPGFRNLKILHENGTLATPPNAILIRHVLSHTGGLRFLNEKDGGIIDAVPLKISVGHDLLEPLLCEPGTKYNYSNEGIDTVGLIIEIISGMSYERFLQKRLFAPLGMADTTFVPSAAQLRRLAKSYAKNEKSGGLVEAGINYLTYPLDAPNRQPAPGGGLFSTARDMLQFCRMLNNGGVLDGKRYLSQAAVRQMTTKQTGPPVSDSYGFGLGCSPDGGRFGHGGAFKTNMTVDHGQIRIFLAQQSGDWADGDPVADFDETARRIFKGTDESVPGPALPAVGTQTPPRQ